MLFWKSCVFERESLLWRQVGWSPTYTLTEDFALGMELKKEKFQCRYVQDYIAVGEAPHEVRNCFQQRSRWTKVGRPPFHGNQSPQRFSPVSRENEVFFLADPMRLHFSRNAGVLRC